MNYEVVYLPSISKWEPETSFATFQIKENAGEEFIEVNNQVKKVCDNIDNVVADLTKLKNLMGENTGTLTELDSVISKLQEKRAEVVDYNKKLIESCQKVVEYVYENKASKADEATQVKNTIANIVIAE